MAGYCGDCRWYEKGECTNPRSSYNEVSENEKGCGQYEE